MVAPPKATGITWSYWRAGLRAGDPLQVTAGASDDLQCPGEARRPVAGPVSAAARGVNADEALPEGPQLPGVVGAASSESQAVRDDVVGDVRADAPVVKDVQGELEILE